MAVVTCLGCGGKTNTTVCNWLVYADKKPRVCYVLWVDGKPEKGCGYEKLIRNNYKEWVDSVLENGENNK